VRRGDPALIVGLRAGGDSRAISTNDSDLVGGVNLLASAGGPLGALAALATALLLGEEGADPGVIDEVAGATEGAEDDKVKEDTIVILRYVPEGGARKEGL
jgi:hypothetical protein